MRSPLGYCRVPRCRRWVRTTAMPKRCPTHTGVPDSMSEMLAPEMKRVYFSQFAPTFDSPPAPPPSWRARYVKELRTGLREMTPGPEMLAALTVALGCTGIIIGIVVVTAQWALP